MRTILLAMMAMTLVAGDARAQSQNRLPADCRREIVALCGTTRDRDAIRSCLREKAAQLSSGCRATLIERMRSRDGAERREGRAPTGPGMVEISYGADPLQRFDYWPAPGGTRNAPLVVFIHGGGWSRGDKSSGTGTKPAFYNGLGAAFASLNYRLVPAVTPASQAADVASALARLRADAERLGHDPDRIILMGHSAGAHLAALVATDTAIVDAANVPLAAVRGVVLLDGAGYDVVRQMADMGGVARRIYRPAFTDDPARQRHLSPITHVGGADAPNWLILHVDSRDQSRVQSEALAAALTSAGARAAVTAVPDSSHMSVNRDAGVAGTFAGDAIARFLADTAL